MLFEHDTLVWFSKTFGLFYLIGLSLLAIAYAFWPATRIEAVTHTDSTDTPPR